LYSFDDGFLIFDRYCTRREASIADCSRKSEDLVRRLWHSSLSSRLSLNFTLLYHKNFLSVFLAFNFFTSLHFSCFSSWQNCHEKVEQKQKTRQARFSNSQQLNVIICKSRNKYETNWHETTAAWHVRTHKQPFLSGVVSTLAALSFYCTSARTQARSAHSHSAEQSTNHPFLLFSSLSSYDCA
jgi:hypothetical protein